MPIAHCLVFVVVFFFPITINILSPNDQLALNFFLTVGKIDWGFQVFPAYRHGLVWVCGHFCSFFLFIFFFFNSLFKNVHMEVCTPFLTSSGPRAKVILLPFPTWW